MNVLYTKSSGPNYGSLAEGDEIESDIGGIVYALDLTSIQLGLASAAKKMSTAARDKKLVGMVNMKEKDYSGDRSICKGKYFGVGSCRSKQSWW
uniref:Uncharacterized protein n=1 Tax=Aegilops tauschii subsp. strangulata TaxID=200361 RepID=A0A453KV46_AEGTS